MNLGDVWHAWRLAAVAVVLASGALAAQDRFSEERKREGWQRVPEIFEAMAVRPGATVADIGAGDGFFTARLAAAVAPAGRVYAVDVSESQLERLRQRLTEPLARNVTIVKGAADDPRLPEGEIDAALIVNAYHEMEAHDAMLAAVRRALKPGGRLVIVEPISDGRRGQSRADQVRRHEIGPEHVVAETRQAGFRVVGLQDPFTERERDVEWMIVLERDSMAGTPPAAAPRPSEPALPELDDPSLRISVAELKRLLDMNGVTVLDVRDARSFAAGHIPGALSTPLPGVGGESERLRRLARPIVTYCS